MARKRLSGTAVHGEPAKSTWDRVVRWGGMMAGAVALAGFCQSAVAATGAFPLGAVLTPDEYDVPTFDKTVNFFFQSGIYDYVGTELDGAGTTRPLRSAQIFEGISRFGQIRPGFEVKGIGRVNWYWEALIPEVNQQLNENLAAAFGQSLTGIGDPLLAAGLLHQWNHFKVAGFDSRATVTVDQVLTVPVGSTDVTARQWVATPFATGDFTVGKLGVQMAVGAQIFSDQRTGSRPTVNDQCPGPSACGTGNNYFWTQSLHYQATKWLMPYLYNVYETGMPDQVQPGVYRPGHLTDLFGGGARVYINPLTFVDAYYLTNLGFIGHNSLKNKAFVFRFVHLWF